MSPSVPDSRVVLRMVLIVLTVVGVLWLIWLLRRPLSWLVLALFIAVAMSGPVNFLERHVRRGFAIALSYLTVLLIPLTIVALIVPTIIQGVDDLAQKAPDYARQLQKTINENERLREIDQKYGVTTKLEEEARKLPSKIGDAANVLKDLGVGIVNSLFAAVTILILSVFMVAGGRGWLDAWLRTLPPDRSVRIRRALDRSANAIGNYVGGVFVQATIAGLTTWIVLLILDVPFAAPLAVLVALLDAIPLIGATIGAVFVAIVTLFADFPTTTIIWVIWAVIYQQVENTVIQPRIQGRAVNVHPFVVIVSVLFGSTLFGIPGALLAVPIAATIQIAGREFMAYRRDAEASREQTGGAGAAPGGPALATE